MRFTRLTKRGRVVVLLLVGLTFAAVNTGNNLVYIMVAWMLGLFVISLAIGRAHCRRLEPSVILPERVTALEVGSVVVAIDNRSRMPVAATTVSVAFDDGSRSHVADVAYVGPKGHANLVIPHVFANRGEKRVSEVSIATTLPFGILEIARKKNTSAQTLVLPEREAFSPPHLSGRIERERVGRSPARAGDFQAIREYRRGDDMRDIHWKLTAKRGTPLVREYEMARARRVVIVLDNRSEGESFEKAVRVACELVLHWLAAGLEVGLATFDEIIQPARGELARVSLLEALATVGKSENTTLPELPRAGKVIIRTSDASSGGMPPAEKTIEVAA